ncbi:MAG: CPBP family intramembrane metalloprotease [Streptococcaceae bacterium]|jgi:membrane protease YdiL (CAAX protease family)|nr:CPBP family intramembrane metalloprotease [Streptococcaceae bacterium]
MENPKLFTALPKKSHPVLAVVGFVLTISAVAILILMSTVFAGQTGKHEPTYIAIMSLYMLFALIVGIVFLSVFSPGRGRPILWLFLLSQVPLLFLQEVYARVNKALHWTENFPVLAIETVLFIIGLGAIYWLAYRSVRKRNVIPPLRWRYFRFGRAAIGFALLFLSQIVINIIAAAIEGGSGNQTSSNQASLNSLAVQVPYLTFWITTISAGFFEELLFRVGSFEILLKKHKFWAFVVAASTFTLAHGPNSWQAAATYGAMAILLTTSYLVYRNFYLNMVMHMSLNFVASGLFWTGSILKWGDAQSLLLIFGLYVIFMAALFVLQRRFGQVETRA